ncbi:MAG: hypothetical protein QW753_07865 [Thermofilum sp.]
MLCTAACLPGGGVEVNGKVVGVDYALKREFIGEAIGRLEEHLKLSDEAFSKGESWESIAREHAARGLRLLLGLIYPEPRLSRGESGLREAGQPRASIESPALF